MTGRNTVVVAGAGTGKTHALVEHYLKCLLGLDDEAGDGAPRGPDQILAITFTDKAAAEMRARVQRRLTNLLVAPDEEPSLVARARQLGRDLPAALVEDLRRAATGAPIFTFHAFCARVLRDHALAAGLDPSFSLLEPQEEGRLLAETAEACVLDALQRGGAETAELVARIALHGFGERKALVESLVDLHGTLSERGVDARSLSLATDASPSVEHMLAGLRASCDALRQRASGNASQRMILIDEACSAVFAAWHSRHERDADAEAAITHAFAALQRHAGGNWGGKAVVEERKSVVAAVEALGAALVDAFTAGLAPAVRDLLEELDARQRREKNARGQLGFGDLLRLTRDLLRGSPGVRASVKSRFARILVDEYQDTSPVQEELLALLLEEPTRGDRHAAASTDGEILRRVVLGAGRAFLVGDPKQSIYGFRGADGQVFTRALDVIVAANGQREELTVSRRSLGPIVEVANIVAEVVLPLGSFGVEPTQLVPLTSLRGGTGPAGAWWLVAPRASDAPEQSACDLEFLVVARQLRALLDDPDGTVRPGDVAVLVRRGAAAVPLARALGKAGIASVVVGGDGLYQRPEVIDVVSALMLAVDPADELAVLTVLRSPLVAVPDDQILALVESLPGRARGLTWPRVREAAAHSRVDDDVRQRIRSFDAVLLRVKKQLTEPRGGAGPVAGAIDILVDDARYAAACAVEPDGMQRLQNLEKLRSLAERDRETALVVVARLAQAIDDPPPEPLAPTFEEEDETEPPNGAARAVRIMTIHQSKGLEFPVVVLADAGSSLRGETDDIVFDPEFGLAVTARGRPIAGCMKKAGRSGALTALQRVRRRQRERSEAELARLLYVALTRARDRLYVVGAPRRAGPATLLGLLELARGRDPARMDALLPRVEVEAVVTPIPLPREELPQASALAPLSPLPRGRTRLRASALAQREQPQLALGLRNPRVDDDDGRLPPRAAGRLAHAVIALVATEAPEALEGEGTSLDETLQRAARACGVTDAPPELLARCAATLRGPVRALLQAGYELSFEENVWLEDERVALEGKADLVARSPERTLVVELKLSAETARSEATLLQLLAYAAALENQGEPAVQVASWPLGLASPPEPEPLTRVRRARLEKALELSTFASRGAAARDPARRPVVV